MSKTMSPEEIRETLGDEAEGYTDDSLLDLYEHYQTIAKAIVRNASVPSSASFIDISLVK